MPIDSFKFLPRLIATFYRMADREPLLPIPWTPLKIPIQEAKFGLITSGGLYLHGSQEPFDLARERREPSWGDPGYRVIPGTAEQGDIAVSHLHLNPTDIETDFNILLPIHRMKEFVQEDRIGDLADHHYTFMGYQGFPANTGAWEKDSGPQVAQALLDEGVHCVLLTPA